MSTKKLIIIISSIVAAVIAAFAATLIIIKSTEKAVSGHLPESNNSSAPIVSVPETSSEEPVVSDNGIRLSFSSPTKQTLTTTESAFTFTGSSDPAEPLTMNGNAVERTADGSFSFSVNLNIEKNTFSFVHKGETHTYTLNYRYVVISDFQPSSNQIYSSGSTFTVSVTARNGSTVTASFNGQTITLSPQEDADPQTAFISYTGSFQLPKDNYADLSLGNIKYSATYNGKSESFQSGKITCKRPDFVVDYDPDATPLGGRYINVGSGKITEIISYEAETFDPYSTDDASRPTNNYLPKGTVDYSAQGYVYYNNQKEFAVLRCGRQIYTSRKDVPTGNIIPVVKEYAGTLPDHNEIGIVALENSGQHTVLTLDTMWKAPFYFDILPQQYNNPTSQDYTVSNVTCNYIDITFCYATVLNGEITVPEDNPLFSSAQIIKGQSDHTLRLYLKKQGGFYGWDANYNDAGQLVFEFLNPAKVTVAENEYGTDLTGVEILIDVGHGGADTGAIGFGDMAHTEAIQNLMLAKKLKAELESIGATVYMTRNDNSTSTNNDKIEMLKALKPDYCIAIHHNSYKTSKPSGFDSYYFNAFSKKAAQYVWMHTSNTNIYKSASLGWHYYYMARCSYCPVVLTENGYISNSYDYQNIKNDSTNTLKAKAITKGIVEYFTSIQ